MGSDLFEVVHESQLSGDRQNSIRHVFYCHCLRFGPGVLKDKDQRAQYLSGFSSSTNSFCAI
jgi:hypothetical protein